MLVPALNFLIIVTKHAVLQEKVDMPCFLLLHIDLTLLNDRAMPREIYLLGDFNLVKGWLFYARGVSALQVLQWSLQAAPPPPPPLMVNFS